MAAVDVQVFVRHRHTHADSHYWQKRLFLKLQTFHAEIRNVNRMKCVTLKVLLWCHCSVLWENRFLTNTHSCCTQRKCDRIGALSYQTEGWGFKSRRSRHFPPQAIDWWNSNVMFDLTREEEVNEHSHAQECSSSASQEGRQCSVHDWCGVLLKGLVLGMKRNRYDGFYSTCKYTNQQLVCKTVDYQSKGCVFEYLFCHVIPFWVKDQVPQTRRPKK